jgi:hypothetical protein
MPGATAVRDFPVVKGKVDIVLFPRMPQLSSYSQLPGIPSL